MNPIAVNSKYCNVFTDNKRAVSIISTEDFGEVCYFGVMLHTSELIFSLSMIPSYGMPTNPNSTDF